MLQLHQNFDDTRILTIPDIRWVVGRCRRTDCYNCVSTLCCSRSPRSNRLRRAPL